MRKVVYIGRFTPPTGGVTAKNTAIYTELNKKIDTNRIDLSLAKKGNIIVVIKCISVLLSRESSIILGTAAKLRRLISHFLYSFNRKAMNRSVLIVMGGQFANIVAADAEYQKWVKEYKNIYVETTGMLEKLVSLGITNVTLFPNCRKRPDSEVAITKRDKPSCVFFSLIQPEKGADLILEAAEKLPDTQFHFYGNIDKSYREVFLKHVNMMDNVVYHGVFRGSSDEVYRELNKYDILLFPTKWTVEGVPGILVEAKIAGLALIVSNMSYNAEFVEDGKDGYILPENTPEALKEKIEVLYENPVLVIRMRQESGASAERFFFDHYIPDVIGNLDEQ